MRGYIRTAKNAVYLERIGEQSNFQRNQQGKICSLAVLLSKILHHTALDKISSQQLDKVLLEHIKKSIKSIKLERIKQIWTKTL